MKMFASMSGQEIVNVCHPETEREQILFDAINKLLNDISEYQVSETVGDPEDE